MKIIFDYQIFGSQRFGGISRYFFEIASHLACLECVELESRIVSPLFVNEYLKYARPDLKVNGIAVPSIKRTGRLIGAANRFLSNQIISSQKADILHETYYSSTSVAPRGSRIVLTVYDMIHELYPNMFSEKDRTSKLKKISVARADHIICISENTRQDLIRLLGVPAEKTTVVHLGFSLTQTEAVSLSEQSKPFLLYVGSRSGYKNFDRLLTAFASSPQLYHHYDLLAFGGGKLNVHELKLMQRLKLSETQVRQIDGDDSVLAGLYKQASMFIYPSLYEGFGIPPLEAMSFDCPVACSNTSSMPEVVGNAAIQFDPLDVDSISNALVELSSNHILKEELIQRGRERVAHFSWSKCAMQTLDVYRRVLA